MPQTSRPITGKFINWSSFFGVAMEIKSFFFLWSHHFYLPHGMIPCEPSRRFVRLPNNVRNPMINPPVLKSVQQQQVDVLRNLISNYKKKETFEINNNDKNVSNLHHIWMVIIRINDFASSREKLLKYRIQEYTPKFAASFFWILTNWMNKRMLCCFREEITFNDRRLS